VTASRTISSRLPEVAAVASSLPPAIAQSDVARFATDLCPELEGTRSLDVFSNAGIEQRHLARPVDWYGGDRAPGERFHLACELAAEHGAEAGRLALDRAGVKANEVDSVVFASTTTLRSPNVDVSLAASLGLPAEVHRVPLFGLASLGGAAALGLAGDLVRAGDDCVLVVCAEMNSMTFVATDVRRDDGRVDMEAIVTLALFSDGAVAAVVRRSGESHRGPLTLIGRHSTLVPASLHVMGFDPTDQGLRWRLAPEVPDVALEWTPKSVGDALGAWGWDLGAIDHALVHPGGARVLDAVEQSLALPADALRWSRDVMRLHGNVSGVTVLLVLEAFLAAGPPAGRVLLTAMGPGFAFEHVLLDSPPR
jgi:alkylresorcinol/alkylpyrone synthase